MKLLNVFRFISITEGISLLLLFGIAMPVKYLFDYPILVEIIGMVHGLFFIAYVLFAIFYTFKLKWSVLQFTIIFFASFIPFGTFYVDKKYLAVLDA
jgi:integral membrane protein